MTGRLRVDLQKCTECRTCELKCSAVHFAVFNAHKSGIRIISAWPEAPQARVCIQCAEPACLPACPSEALVRNAFGSVTVLYDLCGSCNACVEACSYDGIWLDPLSGVAVKCDTCNGRFECIPACLPGALSVVD